MLDVLYVRKRYERWTKFLNVKCWMYELYVMALLVAVAE